MLRHLLTVPLDASEELVSPEDGLFNARGAERSSDATLPAREVQHVRDPPRAVVAPEMVLWALRIDAD